MDQRVIKLFVMEGCSICPQMERLFKKLLQEGAIDELSILDVNDNQKLAEQYHVRSVPHYLINGIAFYGLKSVKQIQLLLQKSDVDKWSEIIIEELSSGQLSNIEKMIQDNSSAQQAMLSLLEDSETALVVRIGLSAIIEGLTESDVLLSHEKEFIQLTYHKDEKVAIDAIYYLSLVGSPRSIQRLKEVSIDSNLHNLQQQAIELLDEIEDVQPNEKADH